MLFEKTETVRITVTGMRCAHCKAAVETALKAVRGVRKAIADPQGGFAEITYVPAKTSPEELAEAIRGAGFEADLT